MSSGGRQITRQGEGERRALALDAVHVERAAVRRRDGLGDGQAETDARDGVALRGGRAKEAGEQLALLTGGDADTGVADGQLGDAAAPGRSTSEIEPSARRQADRSDRVTRPPEGVNFTALETRLSQA